MYITNLLQNFFNYLTEKRGLSPHTLSGYRTDLLNFCAWFKETNGNDPGPSDVTSIDLREYQSYLQNVRKQKPGTVNRRFINLRNFLRWAQEQGYVTRFPSFPKQVSAQKAHPKALERKQQNRLLREVERRGKARDLALVRLLMSCGLRVGEAVSLQVDDLEIGDRHGMVVIRSGKGNKYREVPVPPEARKALKEWLAKRDQKYPKNNPWLFPNRNGGHVSTRHVEGIIKNYAMFAGLEIHPHVLRHTCATNLIRSGYDLGTVADILGHANVSTTAIYTKPSFHDKARALEFSEV